MPMLAGWLAGLVEERIYFKRHFTSGFDVLGLLKKQVQNKDTVQLCLRFLGSYFRYSNDALQP